MGWQRLIISPEQLQGWQIQLTPRQQRYLLRVLRLSPGDRFVALDGAGRQWIAELNEPSGRAAVVESLNPEANIEAQPQPDILLAAAPPKGNGFDEVIRQATELGVSTISPILSDRTLLKPSPKRQERWRRIAMEATEQCERLMAPEVRSPLEWRTFLATHATPSSQEQRFICVARGDAPHLMACIAPPLTAVVLAIGPEGGWTAAEVTEAVAAGFQPVSLGPLVLRAVTAPLAALSVVQAVLCSGKAADHSP